RPLFAGMDTAAFEGAELLDGQAGQAGDVIARPLDKGAGGLGLGTGDRHEEPPLSRASLADAVRGPKGDVVAGMARAPPACWMPWMAASLGSGPEAGAAGAEAKRLFIKTYGGRLNVYASERRADVLRPLGYAPTDTVEDADFVILNTCHIREK